MAIFVAHKEVYIKGEWNHLSVIRSPIDLENWAFFHKYGDTYRRKYTTLTKLDIDFSSPECPVHHLTPETLTSVRNIIGLTAFDKLIGYWPFDDISAFVDQDARKELLKEFVMSNARLVCWIEK